MANRIFYRAPAATVVHIPPLPRVQLHTAVATGLVPLSNWPPPYTGASNEPTLQTGPIGIFVEGDRAGRMAFGTQGVETGRIRLSNNTLLRSDGTWRTPTGVELAATIVAEEDLEESDIPTRYESLLRDDDPLSEG